MFYFYFILFLVTDSQSHQRSFTVTKTSGGRSVGRRDKCAGPCLNRIVLEASRGPTMSREKGVFSEKKNQPIAFPRILTEVFRAVLNLSRILPVYFEIYD